MTDQTIPQNDFAVPAGNESAQSLLARSLSNTYLMPDTESELENRLQTIALQAIAAALIAQNEKLDLMFRVMQRMQ